MLTCNSCSHPNASTISSNLLLERHSTLFLLYCWQEPEHVLITNHTNLSKELPILIKSGLKRKPCDDTKRYHLSLMGEDSKLNSLMRNDV